MDIKYLNYILTIAQERNLHRAAEKLFISQPSLSQYLTKLESEIGTLLFERKSKQMVLTEAGHLYVETAQNVVNLRNKLYRDIANITYQNHLSIATTSQWAMRLVSQILPRFKTEHPGVMIEITESFFPSMSQRLKSREVDICLASMVQPDLDYKVDLLGTEEIMMVISKQHPFYQNHDFNSTVITTDMFLNTFKNDSFLFTTKGSTTHTLMDAMFQSIQFYPRIFGYFDNINTVLDLVSNGSGISFIPGTCNISDEDVCCYHMENKIFRQHIIAYRKDLPITPVVKDLLDSIHKAYRKSSLRYQGTDQ